MKKVISLVLVIMIIMSVDYGDKRTGIAICDKLEMLASPVGVINEGYEPKVIAKVSAEAKRLGVKDGDYYILNGTRDTTALQEEVNKYYD